MNDRDRLIEMIAEALGEQADVNSPEAIAEAVADAIIASGWPGNE